MVSVGVFVFFLALCAYMVYDIVNMADRQRVARAEANRTRAKQEMDQRRRAVRRGSLDDLQEALYQFGDQEMDAALAPLTTAMWTAIEAETRIAAESPIDTADLCAAEKAANRAIAEFAWAAKSYHSKRETSWPTVFFWRTYNALHEDLKELEHLRSHYARLDLCHAGARD